MRLLAKREPWPRFLLKCLVIFVGFWIAWSVFASRYRISYDPQEEKCLPGYTWYLIDLKDQQLERGKIYAFQARNMTPIYPDGTRMVKVLAGLPGDEIAVKEDEAVMINNTTMATGLPLLARLQKPLSQFVGKGVLQPSEYWFLGKSDSSFDSRYWGSVKHDQIIGRAYPLF